MIEPTKKQIDACLGMGWELQDDKVFYNEEKKLYGWFTQSGWVKCFEDDFE